MHVHERDDVKAYRARFLQQVMQAERDGKILIFGDGACVYSKEGEGYCWHVAGEHLYPRHESEGEGLGIHLWELLIVCCWRAWTYGILQVRELITMRGSLSSAELPSRPSKGSIT